MTLAEETRSQDAAAPMAPAAAAVPAPAAAVAAAEPAPTATAVVSPVAATPVPPPPPEAPAARSRRKVALISVTTVVLLAGIAYGVYYMLYLNHFESTDNAYVQGNVVQVTPQVAGTVVGINADDTDFVKAGQSLVKLDRADAQVGLDQAEAQLAQAVREERTLYANNGTLKAQIAAREADLERARSEVQRAQDDVTRRQPLLQSGAVGKEEFNHVTASLSVAKSAVAAAQSAADAAREQLASNQSLTEGISVEQSPNVLRAASRVREAYLALSRTELAAPVDGYVARRSVQLGQRVQAGSPLLSVIPLEDVWVDANFKEGQLRNLRIGQPATLEADVYGKKVEYHGHIEGMGAGTGSAFSLLPAQNATGNWIKIVQRVPVRVALDEKEVIAHPLRVGLSMDVKVDVSDEKGEVLASPTQHPSRAQTSVFDHSNEQADLEVKKIISANLGRSARGGPADANPVAANTRSGGAARAVPAALLQSSAPVAAR